MQEIYLKSLLPAYLGEGGVDWGIPITDFPCIVGRHPESAARINHPLISRRHCVFFLRDDRIWVQDLGSRNGTALNGQWLTRAEPVTEGDRLEFAGLPFQVRLPMSSLAPVVAPEAAVQETEPAGRSHHVLVVEDNASAAETLALLLTQWGHEVRIAHDGPEALQTAQVQQPDTVLLDICLPGMDGYQVAEQLRAQADLGKAQLVAMTGYGPAQDQQLHPAAFDRLLTKPVDLKVLQEVLGD